MVGNDFVGSRPRLQIATPVMAGEPAVALNITPVIMSRQENVPVTVRPVSRSGSGNILDLIHRHSFIVFTLLFLLIGVSGVQVGSRYWSAHIASQFMPVSALTSGKHAISGLSLTVPASQLGQKIQAITSQPATLTVGSQTVAISPSTIKSWLQISSSADKTQQYIYVKSDAMSKSVTDMANKFALSAVNQVSVTHDGVSQVVVAGRDGSKLGDPSTIATQSHALAKTVMDSKGLQFSTPLVTQPFQAVTAADFSKLIEVNVVTKQMYLYDNGQLTRSYPISAGAPATPTPIGEYHIFSKLPVEDMKGFNPNGTKYFQPHVRWINYFLPGGYAVHGNYWRPLSWFGVINSSHGCVSLPDSQAEWVYNWAPLGTTVITHY